MKPLWQLSSLVVLAGALHAQSTSPSTDTQATSESSAIESAPPSAPADGTATPAAQEPSAPVSEPAPQAPPAPPAAKPAPETPAPAKPAAEATKPAPAASSTKPSGPASTPSTGSAKPAAAAASEAPKSDKPDASKPGAETDQGFHYQPGATFGTVTMNGQTWTRLSFTPEISFGKLGVGFNVELFLDQDQNLSSRGWDFNTARTGTESVLRKIDYVRWDHPGAPFYARLGTLEGISMGYGLVAADYGNKARYPDYKLLGANVQLNDITGLGLDFEAVVNDLQDIQNGGPFTAFKAGVRPFKPMGIPVLNGLAVRAGVAYDWNQYAGLRDQDGDGCPDVIDRAPNSSRTCVDRPTSEQVYGLDTVSAYNKSQYGRREDSVSRMESDSLRKNYAVRKPFGVFWLEASLPVIETKFFGLELHSAIAKPKTQDPAAATAGWGAIPLGAGSHLGPITLTAEYRAYNQPFQPNYFNSMYDADRASFSGGTVVTKELAIYDTAVAQKGLMQGYFASASWDIFGFLKLQADYSDLFPSKAGNDEMRAIGGTIGVGPQVTNLLQQKVSLAEVYARKDRIGLDRWTDAEGVDHRDSFFGRSTFAVYGYRIGSQVAPGMTLIIDRQTSFTRDQDGILQKQNQMSIQSQIKF